MTKPLPKQRRRRSDKKYDEKFTKQLMSGIRYTHKMTIAHLCMKWGICWKTYHNWIERYPEFARAHAHGETHYHAYLMDKLHGSLEGEKVNAASLQFALTNVLGWATKNTVEMKGDDTIGEITINVIAPPQPKALEQLEDNTIEGEYSEVDNVVSINGED